MHQGYSYRETSFRLTETWGQFIGMGSWSFIKIRASCSSQYTLKTYMEHFYRRKSNRCEADYWWSAISAGNSAREHTSDMFTRLENNHNSVLRCLFCSCVFVTYSKYFYINIQFIFLTKTMQLLIEEITCFSPHKWRKRARFLMQTAFWK